MSRRKMLEIMWDQTLTIMGRYYFYARMDKLKGYGIFLGAFKVEGKKRIKKLKLKALKKIKEDHCIREPCYIKN